MRHIKRQVVLGLVTGVAAVAAATLVANAAGIHVQAGRAADGSSPAPLPLPPSTTSTGFYALNSPTLAAAPARVAPARLRAGRRASRTQLSILESPATAATLLSNMTPLVEQQPGADLSAARQLRAPGLNDMYLVPTTAGGCLVSAATMVCSTMQALAAGQVAEIDECPVGHPGQLQVVGIAPDGVFSVTVTFVDGSHQDVPVVDNAYAATIPLAPLPRAVTWQQGNATYQNPLSVPPDAGTHCRHPASP